ncbi:DUF1593 domain-containing protein [Parabacteroides sp. PF5-9]|uniref:DUF1593 domain-containing protein n=1 Tax=Parabacteroides sp. PF5-9 TaxID=1742404 RepID=UPI002474C97D|nr:DUF1593 domain-containing protein [Parabacteroides sp. PF5-9]MDH6357926.1 hypothetical protein [Parabacteroides sp. PF5-9]
MKQSRQLFDKVCIAIVGLTLIYSITSCSTAPEQIVEKPRVILTCDPELDDLNSLLRFLLHATDMQIEGLIYASSQFHWKGDGKGTLAYFENREYSRPGMNYGPMESYRWAKDERFIHDAVEAYAASYPNLKIHNPAYPTPEYLMSKVKWGNVEFDGDYTKDTEGSDLIKEVILDDKPAPVYVMVWGGGSTLARALKSIEDTYKGTPEWASIYEKVSKKIIICLSGDQDNTNANYVRPNWPDIEHLTTNMGGVALGYNAQNGADPDIKHYYEAEWIKANILDKGPMGAMYRVWGDGKTMVEGDMFDYFHLSGYTSEELREMGYNVWTAPRPKGEFISEGDTHTFLNFIDNGLRAHEDQSYGGWSGRKRANSPAVSDFSNRRQADPAMPNTFTSAVQNEMAARFQWTVASTYADANHHPQIKAPLSISAAPGEKVNIKGSVKDPDGDRVSLNWWQFKVGTYEGDVTVDSPSTATTTFTVPANAKPGETIHLILEAQDSGTPALTRYHRLIITVV